MDEKRQKIRAVYEFITLSLDGQDAYCIVYESNEWNVDLLNFFGV